MDTNRKTIRGPGTTKELFLIDGIGDRLSMTLPSHVSLQALLRFWVYSRRLPICVNLRASAVGLFLRVHSRFNLWILVSVSGRWTF